LLLPVALLTLAVVVSPVAIVVPPVAVLSLSFVVMPVTVIVPRMILSQVRRLKSG
jgi:hypothetical protein